MVELAQLPSLLSDVSDLSIKNAVFKVKANMTKNGGSFAFVYPSAETHEQLPHGGFAVFAQSADVVAEAIKNNKLMEPLVIRPMVSCATKSGGRVASHFTNLMKPELTSEALEGTSWRYYWKPDLKYVWVPPCSLPSAPQGGFLYSSLSQSSNEFVVRAVKKSLAKSECPPAGQRVSTTAHLASDQKISAQDQVEEVSTDAISTDQQGMLSSINNFFQFVETNLGFSVGGDEEDPELEGPISCALVCAGISDPDDRANCVQECSGPRATFDAMGSSNKRSLSNWVQLSSPARARTLAATESGSACRS